MSGDIREGHQLKPEFVSLMAFGFGCHGSAAWEAAIPPAACTCVDIRRLEMPHGAPCLASLLDRTWHTMSTKVGGRRTCHDRFCNDISFRSRASGPCSLAATLRWGLESAKYHHFVHLLVKLRAVNSSVELLI